MLLKALTNKDYFAISFNQPKIKLFSIIFQWNSHSIHINSIKTIRVFKCTETAGIKTFPPLNVM